MSKLHRWALLDKKGKNRGTCEAILRETAADCFLGRRDGLPIPKGWRIVDRGPVESDAGIPPMPEPLDPSGPRPIGGYIGILQDWGRDLARRLRAILNSHAIVSDALAQAVKREDDARAALDALTRELDDQERSHLKTIDQRDAAEDALGDAYALVTGNQPEWSSAFGYANALEDIDATIAAQSARIATLEEALGAILGREHHLYCVCGRAMSRIPESVREQARAALAKFKEATR